MNASPRFLREARARGAPETFPLGGVGAPETFPPRLAATDGKDCFFIDNPFAQHCAVRRGGNGKREIADVIPNFATIPRDFAPYLTQ